MLDNGLTVRDIADETGLSKSVVGRLKKAIEGEKGTKPSDPREGGDE
jgi:uncharacterized protein YerC